MRMSPLQSLLEQARKTFGVTENLNCAGWIFPDGELGNNCFADSERRIEHPSQAAELSFMPSEDEDIPEDPIYRLMYETGIIRMWYGNGELNLTRLNISPPTMEQIKRISELEQQAHQTYFDIIDKNGHPVYHGESAIGNAFRRFAQL